MVKIFEKDFLDIFIDETRFNGFIVCFDPQKRLGVKTWSVLIANENGDPLPIGLFWDKEEAVFFAEAKNEEIWGD